MIKQVIVIRKDLNMRKGKMVTQGAHASMAVILDALMIERGDSHTLYEAYLHNDSDMVKWLTGSFTKICVSVNSELELHGAYNLAIEAKLPCSIIQDSGRTEFNGMPTYTAVAIGPADSADIDKITGDLCLL